MRRRIGDDSGSSGLPGLFVVGFPRAGGWRLLRDGYVAVEFHGCNPFVVSTASRRLRGSLNLRMSPIAAMLSVATVRLASQDGLPRVRSRAFGMATCWTVMREQARGSAP